MSPLLIPRRLMAVVGGALLIAVSSAIGGAAVARTMLSIPAPNGTITGCYKNSNGNARIVESAAQCGSGESAVTWQQTGPQGPAGPVGPQGEPGNGTGGGAICPACDIEFSDLSHRDLSHSAFARAGMIYTALTDTLLVGADLRAFRLGLGTASGVDFTDAILGMTGVPRAGDTTGFDELEIIDSKLNTLDLRGSIDGPYIPALMFLNVTLRQSEVKGVDLAQVQFQQNVAFYDCDLTGSTGSPEQSTAQVVWSNTICPDGTNSDNNAGQTCNGHWLPTP